MIARIKALPASIFFLLLLTIITLSIAGITEKTIRQQQKVNSIKEISLLRSRLESSLNLRLHSMKGIASYIAARGGIEKSEFDKYTYHMVSNDNVIKNFSIIKNSRITYIFPLKGNRKAIGVDLSKIPDQKESLSIVKKTGKTLVTGPVKLVQGGIGIISRMPIYTGNDKPGSSSRKYWGQVSLVIDEELLFHEAGITELWNNYQISIRGKDGLGAEGRVFFGDPSIFKKEPIILNIIFPNGSWQLAALPIYKGPPISLISFMIMIVGISLSSISSIIFFRMISSSRKLKIMAFHDYLTGLPNRAFFYDRLNLIIELAKRYDKKFSIVMLDINKFKDVNDTYGHDAGDILLKEVSSRLTKLLRSSDTLARLGGDEFIMILPDLKTDIAIIHVMEKIQSTFIPLFLISSQKLKISTSIGFSTFPQDGLDIDDLIKKADLSMYEDKKKKS